MEIIKINTSQNVEISYRIANVGSRMLAVFIDWAILLAFFLATATLAGQINDDDLTAIIVVTDLLIFWFYSLICEITMNGQTFGKRQMKIKVIRTDGTSPSIANYIIRWLLNVVDMQFGGALGLVVIVSGGTGQRIADLAASTTVISLVPISEKNQQLHSDIYKQKDWGDYTPVFANANLISDEDIRVVREAIYFYRQTGNMEILELTVQKVSDALGVTERKMSPLNFLETVIRDHDFLTSQM
jgi:uncharacterized RDD family membrane protein YckC